MGCINGRKLWEKPAGGAREGGDRMATKNELTPDELRRVCDPAVFDFKDTSEIGLINIEREARLSGRTHDKGVLILSGYLGRTFAQKFPLTLSISITFEQSYGGIDGDSASSTELYAILSSLSGIPIRQGIAVTGSVNQRGRVQSIGGVNHKIEGFFDVCKAKGLNGHQGVMIPQTNIQNLMLRREVIAAVAEGRFHIYRVATIEEGIEVLTGVPAGMPNEDGDYPADSVFGAVQHKLKIYMEQALRLNKQIEGIY